MFPMASSSIPILHFITDMGQQSPFPLFAYPIFPSTNRMQFPNHFHALKSLMICPLMELYPWSDVTQNLPQSPFPVTMLQAEYIPLLPHCPRHFLLKLGSRFNFCIDLVQKRAKKSDQRSTKSFPPKSIKMHE